MSVFNQAPKRIHWLTIVFVLALAASGGFWRYQNQIISFVNDWWSPTATSEGKSGITIDDKVFQSEFWQSLRSYGRLPIEPSPTGRANPFRPPSKFVDTPGSRDAKRVSDVITIASSLAQYYSQEGRYPAGQAIELGEESAQCLVKRGWVGESVCAKTQMKYLDSVPRDPGAGQYLYTSDGSSYTLKVFKETSPGGPSFWEYSVPTKTP
ncbi:hypothetical protein A3I40_03815 [Candidatus Uhrbacteria bacterium RIFCSPLOWO2_02_FULL_48_12]|uniref:Uncharacterized protein n=1 Tax=Candidatus Uhrbacteria bacterium RIFCSPLOWO2_02_FULL_48_12 TaxID=1802407 RepID=A0A1F7V9N9_9BACT|nr:MAG: hypothetical protein A3I40_03815 [Candidatus Uhrbacteria bacterium RIFCSPLOWO2_02_FULL_48_12]